MTTTAPPAPVKLNFNNRDYDFSELPKQAQLLLQDMMRLEQQIGQLQFELRHLQAARQVYGTNLRQTMVRETGGNGDSGTGDGAGGDHQDAAALEHAINGDHG